MILNSPYISGSLTVTGNTNLIGSLTVTGSLAGTATSSSFAYTASSAVSAYTASSAVNATTALTASYANTFTVGGTLTAQTLVVQTITSSVSFITGSTRFGSSSINTHDFTGSVRITGSLSGINATFSGNTNNGSGAVFPRLQVENLLATQGDGSTTFNFADVRVASGNSAVQMFMATSFAAGTWEPQGLINVSTNHPLIIRTNNTERMRISAAGTASFTGNSLTSAADAATINLKQNSTTANTGIYLERSGEQKGYYIYMGGSVDSLTFQRNNAGTKADVMSLTRDGNVGIGITSPSSILDVRTGAGTSGNILNLNNTTGASASNIVPIRFYAGNTFGGLEQVAAIWGINPNAGANNGGTLVLATSANGTATTPAEKMRITSTGNALIGTTSESGMGSNGLKVRNNFWQLYAEKTHTSNANFLNVNFNSLTGAAIVTIAHASYKAGVNTYSAIITYYLNFDGVTLSVNTVTASGAGSTSILGTSTAGGGSVTFYFAYSGASNNYSNAAIQVQAVSNNVTEQLVSVSLL